MTDFLEQNFEVVPIDSIEATAATQVRVKINKDMVDQYTEDFQNGCEFPPLDCYREPNSERIILADGFHRHRAAINAGRTEIGCHIYAGGLHEALVHALGANFDHGFRRTNADKRHAVQMALKDPELSQLTPRKIADVCRVAKRTVEKMINEQLAAENENDSHSANSSQSKKKKKASKPTDKDFRDTGKVPTQGEVDLEEAREAMRLVKGLPYNGEEAAGRLPLTKDDIADMEYVSTWLATVVITYRNGDKDG